MKTCGNCKESKNSTDFNKDNQRYDGLQWSCRACQKAERIANKEVHAARQKNYYQANKDRYIKYASDNKDAIKNGNLKRKYGITIEQYESMLLAQDGKCKICQTSDPGKPSFSVDHCHSTGVVRGLLCHSCNSGLGHFKDNKEIIAKAIEYLND